jgi:CRP/FNR family transcriptional regulator, cyclic AMP receptor protein
MGISPNNAFDHEAFLTTVGNGKTVFEIRKNQILFAQGDVADKVFYIQQGKLKLSISSEEGKEAVIAILANGQFLGEGCLNGHRVYVATTTALEDCLITSIAKPAMLSLLHEEPRFSDFFMSYLLTRNNRIEADLIDQLFNSSERRLARALLLLANFGKEGKSQTISPNISQETLAKIVGTTRSRVSFFMNKFRKLGLLDYNGHIEIHSSLLSTVLQDKPRLPETD